ncbi:hypothetical protein H4582DRAFT_2058763 [Lactarius indigo]|nr:hypothetical protein H4582DRAFT_2058763 [Lactarius indigo]
MFVREVLSRSAETALRVYSPHPYDAEVGVGFNRWGTLAQRGNKSTLDIDAEPTVQRKVFHGAHVTIPRLGGAATCGHGYAPACISVYTTRGEETCERVAE